jgi:hypothetical protein
MGKGGGIYNDSGTIDIAPSVSITGNTPDDCHGC